MWGAEYGWRPGGRGQSLLTGASGPLSGKAGPARPRLRGSGVKRGRREGPSSGPARGAQAGRRGLSASDPRASPEPAPSSPSSPLLGSLPLPTPHFTGEGPRGQRGRACCPRAPRLVCGGAGAPPSLHPQLLGCARPCHAGEGLLPPALASSSVQWVREARSASLPEASGDGTSEAWWKPRRALSDPEATAGGGRGSPSCPL